MSQMTRRDDSHNKFIAWGQAYTLIVLIYSGADEETEEQVQSKALAVIHELEADDDYKDILRTSMKIEPQGQFFSMLQED